MNSFPLHLPGQRYRVEQDFEEKRKELDKAHQALDRYVQEQGFDVNSWMQEYDRHPNIEDGSRIMASHMKAGLTPEAALERMRQDGIMPEQGKVDPIQFTRFKLWPLFLEALKHVDDYKQLTR